ncbi:MAG TPA: hypothetical protein VF794_30800 [Archangium sp.]|jgi:hypothetical protein|uniref:hypothetical protein n=1 Tax=Archangium sp. TaxID=1872627 RepID=UPI002ED85340
MALLGGATGCPGPKPDPDCENQPKGCDPASNQDAGQDPVPPPDGGNNTGTPDAGNTDAGHDAGTVDPAKTLVVTQVVSHYNRKGIEAVPRDFTQSPAELISFGGSPIQGTAVAPGQMRFNVPPGTYLVKSSSTSYFLTSARTVDLSYRRFGRPDRGGNTLPVDLFVGHPTSLELSGLEPAPSPTGPYATRLAFNSMDLEETGSFQLSSALTEGQTSVVDPSAGYYTEWGSIPRFDPAQGDSAWVLQTMSRDAGVPEDGGQLRTYDTVVRAAHLNPFSFDGGTLTIKADLQPAPQQDVLFEWRRGEFDALRSASLSGNPTANGSLTILPALKDARDGWVDYSISMLLTYRAPSRDPQTTLVRRFSYGNPYTGWEPVGEFISSYSFTLTNHDGSRIGRTSEQFTVNGPLSELTSTAIRPRVSLPRDFKVDGVPAATPRLMGTTTPTVTWEPPTLGSVTSYTLQVLRLLDESNTLTNVARIYTSSAARAVSLPPGLLTPGNTYALRLTANYVLSGPTDQSPLQYVTPMATASTVSGLLTVP